jgi:hypothetical protein
MSINCFSAALMGQYSYENVGSLKFTALTSISKDCICWSEELDEPALQRKPFDQTSCNLDHRSTVIDNSDLH